MSEMSFSVSHGPVAGRRHDVDVEYRMGLANVRPELTGENQVLVDDDLAQVYEDLFGDALGAYNASQAAKGHPERQIPDYLEHVRRDGKLEPSRELVVQIGNMATNPSGDKTCRMLSSLIYREWLGEFEERFPHLRVYQAAIHMDEATPHLHVAYVPWVDGRKRGLETQNSLSGAYRADGFEDVRDANAEMFRMLEGVAARHGVERVYQGCTRAHMSVRDFKQVVREAGAGSYPWCNDPRLVALVQDQLEAQQVADELLEKGVQVVEDLADALDGTRPLSKESRQAAAEEARGFAAQLRAMLGGRRRDMEARRRFLDMLERLKDWRHWLINPVSEAMRRSRERFASDAEHVGGWRDRVADAMDGFRRTWQPTDLRCGVPDGRSASGGAPRGESAPLGEPAPPSLRDTVQTARECVGDRRGGGRGKSR